MSIRGWVKNIFNKNNGDKNMNDNIKKYNLNVRLNRSLKWRQEEYATWLMGISDEILGFYLDEKSGALNTMPDDFQNAKNYFWVVAAKEPGVKKTHSSLPSTITSTLARILGKPSFKVNKYDINQETKSYIETNDIITTDRLTKILDDNKFYRIHKYHQLPYTLAVGDGCYVPIIDANLSNVPIIEFVDGRYVDFEYEGNKLISVTIKKYFSKGADGYVLCDRRSTIKSDEGHTLATVEYKLFKLKNLDSDEVDKEVELSELDELKHLENLEFPNFDRILAVPVFFEYDIKNRRGLSIFRNKIDLCDDLDQSLSQRSNSSRMSTPVEYVSENIIDRNDVDGKPTTPKRYDRRFLVSKGSADLVGRQVMQAFETSQPQINFSQFNEEALEITMQIISGILSPSTLGIDLARKDNADAQREKEKVTFITRDSVIDDQMDALSDLAELILQLDDYMKNRNAKPKKYKVYVNYPEYANPSFDAKANSMVSPYSSGMVSPERLVDEIWGDSLSPEDKQKEIEYLTQQKTLAAGIPKDDGSLFPFGE